MTSSARLLARTFDLLTSTALTTVEKSQSANIISQVAKITHALETLALARLRTPLLVLRRWPSAGEVESGITTCTDVIGVRNRRLVNACLRVVYGEAGMLEILPDAVPMDPAFSRTPARDMVR